MQYNFKTQELTSKGVDFNAIYPDKQDAVKQMTGFDFNLSNIVSFLKKETNDYEKQTPLALDIDKHIYSVYLKWQQAEGKSTEEQKASEPTSDDANAETLEAISFLEELASDQKGKDKKETLEAIEFMKELLV